MSDDKDVSDDLFHVVRMSGDVPELEKCVRAVHRVVGEYANRNSDPCAFAYIALAVALGGALWGRRANVVERAWETVTKAAGITTIRKLFLNDPDTKEAEPQ